MTNRRLFVAIAAVAAWGLAAAPLAAANEAAHGVVKPADVKWRPFDPKQPNGIQIGVLAGDPSKAGTFVIRVKFPAGSEVPSHLHSSAETISVLSGRLLVAFGVKPDKASAAELGPGGFFWMKAGDHHQVWAPEETIIDVTGQGPFDIHYD